MDEMPGIASPVHQSQKSSNDTTGLHPTIVALEKLKLNGNLVTSANNILSALEGISQEQKTRLGLLFQLTLANDAGERSSDFSLILNLLDTEP